MRSLGLDVGVTRCKLHGVSRVVAFVVVTVLFWPVVVLRAGRSAMPHAESLGYRLGGLSRTAPDLAGAALETPQELPLGDPRGDVGGPAPVIEELAGSPEPPAQSAQGVPSRGPGTHLRPRAAATSGKTSSAPAAPKRGLRVSASTVLRLANARAVPEGVYQGQHGQQPAGMRLMGVSALGVGLQDGDVLSDVAGTPATSRSAVVSAVLQVRARQAEALSATFWRDGEPWRLIVEMPYQRRAAPGALDGRSARHAPPEPQVANRRGEARLSPN